jgi:hypothetical protein
LFEIVRMAGIIDEEFLSSMVFLPEGDIEFLHPLTITVAELAGDPILIGELLRSCGRTISFLPRLPPQVDFEGG